MSVPYSYLNNVEVVEYKDCLITPKYNLTYRQAVRANYLRVLSQWPVDALRPNVSFQKSIRNRIDKRLSDSSSPSADNVVANEAQVTVPSPKPFAALQEVAQVNVLYSFLEDRYSRKVNDFQVPYSTEIGMRADTQLI